MRIVEAILLVSTVLFHYLSSQFMSSSELAATISTVALGLLYFPMGIKLFQDAGSLRRWQLLSLFSGFSFALALLGAFLRYTFVNQYSGYLVASLFCCLMVLVISGLFLFRNEAAQKRSLPYYRALFYRSVFYILVSLAFLGADQERLIALKYSSHPGYAILLKQHLEQPDNLEIKAALKQMKQQLEND